MQSGSKPQSPYPVARHNPYIHPLFWTSRQLDLVGCRFEDLEAENELQSHEHDCPNEGLWTIEAAKLESEVEQLAKSCAPLVKTHALVNILGREGSPFERLGKEAAFFFRGQMVHQPQCVLFSRRRQPSQPDNRPLQSLVGYFNYTDVKRRRQEKLRPRQNPGGGHNAPGQRLFQKRLFQITPLEWAHDPYLVCILLSIAQLQERSLNLPRRTAYMPRLLVSNSSDVEFFHSYEAQITTDLLKWLDGRSTTTGFIGAPIIVKRRKIPFRPFKDFVRRIASELLGPGPWHQPNTSYIENDAGSVHPKVSKRKCEDDGSVKRLKRPRSYQPCGSQV